MQKVTLLVDEQPTRAAIDPYHRLVDRNPDDKWVDVGVARQAATFD